MASVIWLSCFPKKKPMTVFTPCPISAPPISRVNAMNRKMTVVFADIQRRSGTVAGTSRRIR